MISKPRRRFGAATWVSRAIASLHMAAARDISACAARAISRPHEPERRSSVSRCNPTVASVLRISWAHCADGAGFTEARMRCRMEIPLFRVRKCRRKAWLLGIAPSKGYDHESGLGGQYPLV